MSKDYWKRPLGESELIAELGAITDEMAEESDVGGDEDADDCLPVSVNTSVSSEYAEASISVSHVDDNDSDEREGSNDIQQRGEDLSSSSDNDSNIDNNEANHYDSDGNDTLQWSKRCQVPQQFSSTTFCEPFGLSQTAEVDINSPLQILMLILPSAFLQLIVIQTNLYAAQNHCELGLSIEELKAFLGILIIMGFNTLPSMRLYWSTDCNFHNERISSVMPLKRFLKILRCLHLNDNSKMPKKGEPEYDRMYKLRPLLNHVNKIFKDLFHPSRNLSIDESMVRFKGRSSLKQYMPMKPIKRGFKIWVVACAVTGYCLGMSVYEGKYEGETTELSLGERVINTLCKTFEGLGYCLFFDNFFSNIIMMKRLLRNNFFVCATIRQTRRLFPKNMLAPDKQLKMGESDSVMAGNIGVSKWKDRGKKCVTIVSTMHNAQSKAQVQRTNKEGKKEVVPCPESIKDYNKYMGGVDHFDQLHSTYNLSWKSRRWWLKIFYYCIDACIVNSYILYQTTIRQSHPNTKPLTHLKYRSMLATQLISSYCGRMKKGPVAQTGRGKKRNHPDGRPTIPNAKRLINVGNHLPEKGPTFRRCAHCSTAKKQKRSRTICAQCNVALCVECFAPFHKPKK